MIYEYQQFNGLQIDTNCCIIISGLTLSSLKTLTG